MSTGPECSASQLVQDLIFAALRLKDERLNNLVMEILATFGPPAVSMLVPIASRSKNPPGYRLRALEAIARIDGPLPDGDFFRLTILASRDRNPKIREAAGVLTIPHDLFDPLRLAAYIKLARAEYEESQRQGRRRKPSKNRPDPGATDPAGEPA